MTAPGEQPINFAAQGSQVGVQAINANIDTVTITGDAQLTVSPDATPQAKYRAGVENLKSGNPGMARTLIWNAMMGDHVNNTVLFHWLVAMLSGRTLQQFSEQEIGQLNGSRSLFAEAGDDAWSDGVRLIYQILDTALKAAANSPRRNTAETDMSILIKQFDNLGEQQRDMVQEHLERFLTGPLKDEVWQRELQLAQTRQHADDRLQCAWMFFQPNPAEVLLPPPRPERMNTADRLAIRAGCLLSATAAAYLGWQLLWHGALLGLLSYAAALAGGALAAATDLEWRFRTGRLHRKEELFREQDQPSASPPSVLAAGVNKLFSRYFTRYAPDKAERQRWEAAAAGIRKFYRDEIIGICQGRGISAKEVAWFIRYEVRQLQQRWQDGTLYEYRRELLPSPGTVVGRRAGQALLVIGGIGAIVALRAHLLAGVVAVASAFWTWRCWLRVNLERRRFAADSQEFAERQGAIDKEFRRWREKLEARPKDADMAAWLRFDRTVLLGEALDLYHLRASRLMDHAVLDEPGVAVKRARIDEGSWRYARYRLRMFLLTEDGVRHVSANLDFMTGTLTIREQTSHRYEGIVSVRCLRERRQQKFEIRLTAGEPITIRLRDTDPGEAQDDGPAEETQEAQAEDDAAPDMTNVAGLLHTLEGVAGEGQNWFRNRDWVKAQPGNDKSGGGTL